MKGLNSSYLSWHHWGCHDVPEVYIASSCIMCDVCISVHVHRHLLLSSLRSTIWNNTIGHMRNSIVSYISLVDLRLLVFSLSPDEENI